MHNDLKENEPTLNSKTKDRKHIIYTLTALLLLLFVAYFQLFSNLDKLPLRIWDEGKNAVSAYEMYTNGNYLVRYYEGQPDDWGFKPPFLTWNQIVSMKIFGVNDFATRFPSALYALFTALLMFYFFYDEFKKPIIGLLASLILLTSYGYLEHHIARYGDHDSILVFFLASQMIFFYKFITQNKSIHLIFFTASLIFASLTKGIAGLFFVPGIAVYLTVSSKLKKVLSDRRIYFCAIAYLLFIGGYYILREISSPGYLKAVWENELLPRYTNTASNYKYEHTSDYLFYIRNLWNERIGAWMYLLPFTIALILVSKNKNVRTVFWYSFIIGISFLLLISGGSKGTWYDAPIFPVFAICLALGFLQLYISFKDLFQNKYFSILVTFSLFAPFLLISVQNTKILTYKIEEKYWNREPMGISYFLRDHQEELSKLKDLGIAYNGYHSHIRFYANIACDNGTNTYFVNYKEIDVPSVVIASQKDVQEFIEENYIFTTEKEDYGTIIYYINGKKTNE